MKILLAFLFGFALGYFVACLMHVASTYSREGEDEEKNMDNV